MNSLEYIEGNDHISVYKYPCSDFKSESISVCLAMPTCIGESVKRSLLLSVLKRGTEKYPTQRAINERLDELYATLVGFKNQKSDAIQLLGLTADVIKSRYTGADGDILPDVLDVIGEVMFHPLADQTEGFSERYVESEKENYKSVVLSQINEPRTYAAIRCREEMMSSLGITDKLDTMCDRIDRISSSELFECYKDISRSSEIIAFYAGERDIKEVLELIRGIAPPRQSVKRLDQSFSFGLLKDTEKINMVWENADISQGRLVIGLNCGITQRDREYYAMLLCNEILGGSPISKLMMNVRERHSLCYECSSVYNSARGAIFITTGIESADFELARDAIFEQISDIKNGIVSDAELSAAKKSLINVYRTVTDSQSAIERFYLGRIIAGAAFDDPGDVADKIERLTLRDITEAAKHINVHTVYFLSSRGGDSDE